MGILEIIFFALWVICVLIALIIRPTFGKFILSAIGDALVLGVLYVIIHLAIKHW
jgi:hypothetical protein